MYLACPINKDLKSLSLLSRCIDDSHLWGGELTLRFLGRGNERRRLKSLVVGEMERISTLWNISSHFLKIGLLQIRKL